MSFFLIFSAKLSKTIIFFIKFDNLISSNIPKRFGVVRFSSYLEIGITTFKALKKYYFWITEQSEFTIISFS